MEPNAPATIAQYEHSMALAPKQNSMPSPGKSILDLAKASTSGAQQNYLCQTPLTSLSIIINLLRFGLETAVL